MKRYQIGVDIGRDRDPSAIIVAEVLQTPVKSVRLETGGNITWADSAISRSLLIAHAEEPTLKTDYPALVNRMQTLYRHSKLAGQCDIAVDATGVGAPVVAYLREAQIPVLPVVITAGTTTSAREDGGWNVPKVDLVDSIIALLHSGRIAFADGLPLADKIKEQLREFQIKRRAGGKVSYENSLDSIHDDMVIALGLVCWRFVRAHGASLTYTPGRGKVLRSGSREPLKRW